MWDAFGNLNLHLNLCGTNKYYCIPCYKTLNHNRGVTWRRSSSTRSKEKEALQDKIANRWNYGLVWQALWNLVTKRRMSTVNKSRGGTVLLNVRALLYHFTFDFQLEVSKYIKAILKCFLIYSKQKAVKSGLQDFSGCCNW